MGRTDGLRNDTVLAEEAGISRQTIQRYIRLTYLIPELLQLVDLGKLPKNTASELSYLPEAEQKKLFFVIEQMKKVPSGAQAMQLKQKSRECGLEKPDIRLIMSEPGTEQKSAKISLSGNRLRTYFPESYTGEQMEKIIYQLLEEWKRQEMNKV